MISSSRFRGEVAPIGWSARNSRQAKHVYTCMAATEKLGDCKTTITREFLDRINMIYKIASLCGFMRLSPNPGNPVNPV